jgi:hypothetical protein
MLPSADTLHALAGPVIFASIFQGETLDKVADYIAIFVLFFVPAVLVYLFWMVHILPEKIAHQRHHPQLDAIKTLCLLSLVFGGLLWPIAWIWAYTKPVMHKMAYGTDKADHETELDDPGDEHARPVPKTAPAPLEEVGAPRSL